MKSKKTWLPNVMPWFLVAAGGALGTALRVGVSEILGNQPFVATLVVNVVGAFLLALLVSGLTKWGSSFAATHGRNLQLLLGAGVLGGFTTYSTFAFDSAFLFMAGETVTGLAYVALTLGLGATATLTGLWLGGESIGKREE